MRTDGAIITNAGQELLSYALANNKQVNFTKVKLGKGDVNTFDEAKKLTDVVSFYKQIPITSIARNNAGVVRIRSSFTNADFPLQVVLKEIGVFAVVEGKSEVLFGYVNDGEGESFPPGSSGNIVERVRDIYVGVSTNTQVTAVIDRSVVYATIYDLDEEIAKCAKKITRVNPGNGIHGGGTLGEDITVSIKSNDTSINLDATNGITLKKTTSWLNDAAQLFTAKGALNLFNTLTTNFTDAINIAKEALRIDIGKKYNKVGNLINNGDDLNNYTTAGHFRVDGDALAKTIGNRPFLEAACAFTLVVDHIGTTGYNYVIQIARNYASGEIKVRVLVGYPTPSWSSWSNQWDSSNAPKSSRLDFDSEIAIATSKAIKLLNDSKEPNIDKKTGFNLNKTDLTENDSNKVFTPKGALDLKNWLVENYTTLMNNIRDNLTNTINTKTPHGGYNRTSQDLKNEIDTKYNNVGISIPYNADLNNYISAGHFRTEGDALAQTILNRPFIGSAASFTLVVDHIYSSGTNHIIQIARHYGTGEIRIRTFNSTWNSWSSQWDSSNAPKSSRLDFDSEIAVATSKAIKLLNDGKISRDGDYQLTGDYKTTGSYSATKFIANNNYGYMCKDTNGVDKYIALIGTDGRLHIGWNNETPITLDASDIKIQNHIPYHDGNLDINYQQGLLRPLQLYTANDLDNIGQGFWGTYGDAIATSLGNAPFPERGQASSFGMIGLGYDPSSIGGRDAIPYPLMGQIAISVYDGEMKCRNKGRNAPWRTLFDSTNCRASFAASSQHGSFTMPNDVTIQYGYGDTGINGRTYVVQLHKAFKEGFSVVCTGSGGGHFGVFNARPNGLGSFIIDAGNMVLGDFNGSKFRWIAIGK